MRLQAPALPPEAWRTVLVVLMADPVPANLPEEGYLLYCCSNKVEFVKQMPLFDEWGPRLVGLDGTRESPVSCPPCLPRARFPPQEWAQGGGRCRAMAALLLRNRHHLGLLRCHPMGPCRAILRKRPRERRSPMLLRPEPSRLRWTATRRVPRSPRGPAPLSLPPQESHHPCPALVTTPRASASSNQTSRRSARGGGLQATMVTPSGH